MIEVTEDTLNTPHGLVFQLAHDFLDCLCEALRCSPYGVPEHAGKCGHAAPEDGEACKTVVYGNELRTLCCGYISVGIGRMFWHDGKLVELTRQDQFEECLTTGYFWGVELNVAVLRCTPELSQGWGGIGGTKGLADPETQGDHAAILSSDRMAIMLAQEACFCREDRIVGGQEKTPKFVPAPVEPYSHATNCHGNIVGWGRTRGIRLNLNDAYGLCSSDCIALYEKVTG